MCFKNSTHLVIQTSSLTLNSRAISMALICNLLDTVYAIFVRQAYDMWTTIPKNGGREIFQKAGKFETHCRPQKIPSCTVQWPSWLLCTPSHPTLSTSIFNPVAPPLRVFCPTMYLFLTFFFFAFLFCVLHVSSILMRVVWSQQWHSAFTSDNLALWKCQLRVPHYYVLQSYF